MSQPSLKDIAAKYMAKPASSSLLDSPSLFTVSSGIWQPAPQPVPQPVTVTNYFTQANTAKEMMFAFRYGSIVVDQRSVAKLTGVVDGPPPAFPRVERNKDYFPEARVGAPWILDLYCGAGGASEGYFRAGFNVLGVDIEPQPHYPFEFMQADALAVLASLVGDPRALDTPFVAIHASPPCQRYSHTRHIDAQSASRYPDLIAPTRKLMKKIGLPYIIENVEGARSELENPALLCGSMFPSNNLRVYRHRLFETSFHYDSPKHSPHITPQAKMGRRPKYGQFMHVVGNFSGVPEARYAMGIPWMTRNELREAIPPAYTMDVSHFLKEEVKRNGTHA